MNISKSHGQTLWSLSSKTHIWQLLIRILVLLSSVFGLWNFSNLFQNLESKEMNSELVQNFGNDHKKQGLLFCSNLSLQKLFSEFIVSYFITIPIVPFSFHVYFLPPEKINCLDWHADIMLVIEGLGSQKIN